MMLHIRVQYSTITLIYIYCVVTLMADTLSTAQADVNTCSNACKCAVSNLETLSQLVDARFKALVDGENSQARINSIVDAEFGATIDERIAESAESLGSDVSINQVIKAKVDEKFTSVNDVAQPGIGMWHIKVSTVDSARTVALTTINTSTFVLENETSTTLNIEDTSVTARHLWNTLAYYPRYQDVNSQSMAVIFVHMERIVPCLSTTIAPSCNMFTYDDVNRYFRKQKPIVYGGDINGGFSIFVSLQAVSTLGFGFSGCPTFDHNCVPDTEFALMCMLHYKAICN